jgi:hypothetical protein
MMAPLSGLGVRYVGYFFIASLFCKVSAQSTCCPFIQTPFFGYQTCLPATDDVTGSDTRIPWTHSARCAMMRSAEKGEKKYCVYSSSSFNDNSGIGVITTPDTAASMVEAVLVQTDAWRARRYLANQNQTEYDRDGNLVTIPYVVKQVPGKGIGVVATRRIKQFEVFMISYPAVIAHNDFFPGEGVSTPDGGDTLFQTALDQLVDKERLTSLAQNKPGEIHIVEDTIRTNAFGIVLNGQGHKGLYPEIARMNHACDPK